MSDRTTIDTNHIGDDPPATGRHGPGRWLLTWAGVFTMVIVLAAIFATTIVLVSR